MEEISTRGTGKAKKGTPKEEWSKYMRAITKGRRKPKK
jgi:hypothetical protein